MHLIPTDSKKGDLSRFFIDRCIGLHLYSEGTKTRNQGPMTQWIYYLHLFLFSLGIWSYQIHLQMMPSIKYQYADISSCGRITRGNPPRKSSSPIRAAEYFRPLHRFKSVDSAQKIETGLECDQWLLRKLKITVTGAHCATLLCEHSISQFCFSVWPMLCL